MLKCFVKAYQAVRTILLDVRAYCENRLNKSSLTYPVIETLKFTFSSGNLFICPFLTP